MRLLAFALAAALGLSAHAQLVINEIDYDQPGNDSAEFIELVNLTPAPVDLTHYCLLFVNGATGISYLNYFLEPVVLEPWGYFVVCSRGSNILGCSMEFPDPDNSIQNGAPDGVLLYDTQRELVVDAVSYEGSITAGATPFGVFNLVEGSPTPALDSGLSGEGLSRLPDGTDSNDAAADWGVAPLTPGRPNARPCDPDLNCDGNTDYDDVECSINIVAGNPGCECQDLDFNRDGNVDQDDVAAVINVIAGGDCP